MLLVVYSRGTLNNDNVSQTAPGSLRMVSVFRTAFFHTNMDPIDRYVITCATQHNLSKMGAAWIVVLTMFINLTQNYV